MVLAKFRCNSILRTADGSGNEANTVRFSAVTDKANEEWSRWTPSGMLEISITNPALVGTFKLNQDYFLDFSPAE